MHRYRKTAIRNRKWIILNFISISHNFPPENFRKHVINIYHIYWGEDLKQNQIKSIIFQKISIKFQMGKYSFPILKMWVLWLVQFNLSPCISWIRNNYTSKLPLKTVRKISLNKISTTVVSVVLIALWLGISMFYIQIILFG